MAKRAKKDKKFIIRCTFCLVDDYRLEDVKIEDTVKIYTDSPFKFMKQTEAPVLKESHFKKTAQESASKATDNPNEYMNSSGNDNTKLEID